MNCGSCGHSNGTGAKFCDQCGTRLERACPSCGEAVGDDAKFCRECGQTLGEVSAAVKSPDRSAYTPPHLSRAILRDHASMEGERRIVTVLFADAAGFTSMSEKMDEEEVYDLMQGCSACMMDAVHRYEGTVNQYLGDGVMALFGAPIAHEDSARRAIAAALDMQEALIVYADQIKTKHPISCRFRVGLNTGPVVVGSISDDLSMDYTAVGDTVNLASRMEQLAGHGEVYLTESTQKIAQDYFEFEDLGALIVKGKKEPVRAFKALCPTSVLTRLDASTERGLTPYVGREHELNTLAGYLKQVEQGTGQVVFVSGEAGIGKSRLLLEFRKSLADSSIRWVQGQCISFGKSIPYLPIVDLLRRNFQVEESQKESEIVAKVGAGVEEWDAPSRETVPYLKFMMNVDPGDALIAKLDPAERRAGFFDGLRALVREESKNGPIVMVVEDLHWVDDETEAALQVLADTVAASPVLMILTSRPGYKHTLGDRSYYSRVALAHLTPEAGTKLAQEALRSSELPDELRKLISLKAEGNPFYIEEVTKSLVETGVLERKNGDYRLARSIEEAEVPGTIQEVILSRIDRLDRESREALQLASVIGREFTVRLLKRISNVRDEMEGLLSELKALELIYEVGYLPELSYMFKHALTHDVAYSTLLIERRKMLHRIVATSIEELYPDRIVEYYEMLAHHYYEAQDWEKALNHLEKAADKAKAAFANQEALDFYARAMEVAGRLGDPARKFLVTLARKRAGINVIVANFSHAIADLNVMRQTARDAGDPEAESAALAIRSRVEWMNHDFDEVRGTVQEVLDITGIVSTETCLTAMQANWHTRETIGDFDEADRLYPQLEMVANELDRSTVPDESYGTGVHVFECGLAHNWHGIYDEALQHLDRWQPQAERWIWNLLGANWARGVCLGGIGDYERAAKLLMETVATGDRIGEVFMRIRATNSVGWIFNEIQSFDQAIDWNQRGVDVAVEATTLDSEVENNARLNLGDTYMALGHFDMAHEQFERVGEIVRNPKPEDRISYYNYSPHYLASAGDLACLLGEHERAIPLADQCIEMAIKSRRPKNEVKGRRLRGRALMTLGELGDAENELARAAEIARTIGNPPQLWKTLTALGDLRAAQKDSAQASGLYREAVSVVNAVAGGLEDDALQRTFLASNEVSALQQTAGG